MEKLAPGIRFVGTLMRLSPATSISKVPLDQVERIQKIPEPTHPVAKRVSGSMLNLMMGGVQKGIKVEDRTISNPGGVSNVPIRIYTPERVTSALRPLVVYFHGGGWVLGSLRMGDWMCSVTAHELDAVVVSVDYRLAPQHKFPAGLEDCYTALVWCSENGASLGADAGRLGVMGESAGGNLAAVVCLLAKERGGPQIKHQALLYPAVGGSMETDSCRINKDALILTAADMETYYNYYVNADTDPRDWRIGPLFAPDFSGLPPAIIIVAGHDPLHDDGVAYAKKLREAGINVTLQDYPAMPHGFLNFPHFSRDAKPAFKEVIKSQRAALQK
ncbi:MAG TPA: alpha/beta hydrolase [Chloroflexia bacterium]|nr:alpha/beta hydrolase [Chloroflexia bacterium]